MGNLTGEQITNYCMAKVSEIADNAASVPANQERANYAIDKIQELLDQMLTAAGGS